MIVCRSADMHMFILRSAQPVHSSLPPTSPAQAPHNLALCSCISYRTILALRRPKSAHTRREKTNVAKMIGKRTNVYAPHDRKSTPAMFFLPRRRCVDVGFLIRKRIFFFKITTSTRLRSLRTCTKVYDLLHFLEVLAVDASPCNKNLHLECAGPTSWSRLLEKQPFY